MVRIYKTYKWGDLITVSVTKGYEEIASEFFDYCGKNGLNPSELIRKMIYNWISDRTNGTGHPMPRRSHKRLKMPSSVNGPQDVSDEIFRQLMEVDE